MKIILTTSETASIHRYTGGVGSRFEYLAAGLAARGHEVTLVTSSYGVDDSRVWPWPGVQLRVFDAGAPAGSAYPLSQALEYSRIASGVPGDIIFAPEWRGFLAPYLGVNRCRQHRHRVPVVTNLVTSTEQIAALNGAPQGFSPRFSFQMTSRLERAQTKGSTRVVAISNAILRWTRQLWGELPDSEVIPNGINVADTLRVAQNGDPLWLTGRLHGGPVVMTTGRVCRWKGALVLMDAMRAVWKAAPEAQLVFGGSYDNPVGRQIVELATSLNEKRPDSVILGGHQPRANLLAGLRHASIAVFPSIFEGFGNGCLEAKALGLPVVATAGSGFDDFCTNEEDSLLVPPGRADALGCALVAVLLDSAEASRLGARAKQTAWQNDIESYVAKIERALAIAIS